MTDVLESKCRWFRFRPRTLLVLVLTCGISCGWLAVKMRSAWSQPQVLATVDLDGDHFYGAAANSDMFFVLVDDALHAYSSSGVQRWQKDAPWYKHPNNESGGKVLAPNFNRPAPVVMNNAVVVLNCKNWELSLDAYDFSGNLLATVKPLPHNMELQGGILHLAKAANSLAFGYRLESKSTFDNPDKGLIVFDDNLHKLREHDVWGDHLCCSNDGSMYVRTVRWGKDTKWARISPDGHTTLLPTAVSRCTWVVQPGIGGEMILWGSTNINGEPSDSESVRRIWNPSMSDATTIIEYKKEWLGEMVACPNSRYVVRVWPDHKQKFLCLSSEGKTLWEHDLTLSCYFWPPDLLCGPDGKVYFMDTVPGFHLWASDVVLRCLTASGETDWELKVDQTDHQPVFASCIAPSGSHLLLARRSSRINDSLGHKVKLVFVATGIVLLGTANCKLAGVTAEPPTPPAGQEERIAAEIARLGSSNESECADAVKALVKIGRPAAPALVKVLNDPRNEVRAFAAEALRAILAADPTSAPNYHEKAYWEQRLAQLKAGMALDEALTLLMPELTPAERQKRCEGVHWSGGSGTSGYRLDDYWAVWLYLVDFEHKKLHEHAPDLFRSVRQVWVALPPDYTGVRMTWYVNGQKANESQCSNGRHDGIVTAFYDDGPKCYEQHYTMGVCQGTDTAWYRSGKKRYEGEYENNKQTGTWQWWKENGQVESIREYKDGKQIESRDH